MAAISFQLMLILLAILAIFTVASPVELDKEVTDGYFTMCMLPDFVTHDDNGDWSCEYRLPWVSGQCYTTSNTADPKSLHGYVKSAKPEDDYGATCHMYRLVDCKGDQTPDIKAPGLNDFGAAGYHGDTLSWKCDCGATCIDADATVTATFDPDVTNSPLATAPPPPALARDVDVASSVKVKKRAADGLFNMCMRPDFSTDYYGTFACETVEWTNEQCNLTPQSLFGWVQSAMPAESYGATCMMFSNDDCTGKATPPIEDLGIADFAAAGYHGDTLSWVCDCKRDCLPENPGPSITLDTGTPPGPTRAT